jgi:hypothetical protein
MMHWKYEILKLWNYNETMFLDSNQVYYGRFKCNTHIYTIIKTKWSY